MTADSMLEALHRRQVRVCVVGLGYVGLPTLAVIGAAGFLVTGVDIQPEVVERISQGEDSRGEPGLGEALSELKRMGRLRVDSDLKEAMRDCGVIVLCIQTPVDAGKLPNLSFLRRAVEDVGSNLQAGTLVILESTVPPRTTQTIVATILEERSNLTLGRDFWLAYCPERVSPGGAMRTVTERPRLVGGINEDSAKLAAELLRSTGVKEILQGDVAAVEVAKTAENAFRDVNIAFANELALLCEQMGVDVYEVIRLANTHERVRIHQPGAGVGGPCLTKDPYLLSTPAGGKRLSAGIIDAARRLNDTMPKHAVDLVAQNLAAIGINVQNSSIGVLGVTYRGGTDDVRNSPAEEIIKNLVERGAHVLSFDPMSQETFGSKRVGGIAELLHGVVCVVIAADHKEFRRMKISGKTGLKLIVDGRRMLDPQRVPQSIRYVAIGDLTHT